MDLGIAGRFHGRMACQPQGVAIIALLESGPSFGIILEGFGRRLLLVLRGRRHGGVLARRSYLAGFGVGGWCVGIVIVAPRVTIVIRGIGITIIPTPVAPPRPTPAPAPSKAVAQPIPKTIAVAAKTVMKTVVEVVAVIPAGEIAESAVAKTVRAIETETSVGQAGRAKTRVPQLTAAKSARRREKNRTNPRSSRRPSLPEASTTSAKPSSTESSPSVASSAPAPTCERQIG